MTRVRLSGPRGEVRSTQRLRVVSTASLQNRRFQVRVLGAPLCQSSDETRKALHWRISKGPLEALIARAKPPEIGKIARCGEVLTIANRSHGAFR